MDLVHLLEGGGGKGGEGKHRPVLHRRPRRRNLTLLMEHAMASGRSAKEGQREPLAE